MTLLLVPWLQSDVTDVAWSPDGSRLATASVDNTVKARAARARARTAHPGSKNIGLESLERSCSARPAAPPGPLQVWDAASGHCLRTLEGHHGHVRGVAWDPIDVFLASMVRCGP